MLDYDFEKAKENRERIKREQDTEAYYWWQMADPFGIETVSDNPTGLARSKQELKNRQGGKQ